MLDLENYKLSENIIDTLDLSKAVEKARKTAKTAEDRADFQLANNKLNKQRIKNRYAIIETYEAKTGRPFYELLTGTKMIAEYAETTEYQVKKILELYPDRRVYANQGHGTLVLTKSLVDFFIEEGLLKSNRGK
jgi:hypothetical protein